MGLEFHWDRHQTICQTSEGGIELLEIVVHRPNAQLTAKQRATCHELLFAFLNNSFYSLNYNGQVPHHLIIPESDDPQPQFTQHLLPSGILLLL